MLKEMETENAYQVLSEMKEDRIVPKECKEEIFTIMVADITDRTEDW